jgi:hypothetical protein
MTTTSLLKRGSMKERIATMLGVPGALNLSVRVPVTEANREYLRAIRQAELEAWRSAPGGTLYARGTKG